MAASGPANSGPVNTPVRRVQVLPESVARKIAAGEVIDRPHAVVRELLDNALDAGATEITLSIEGGGIDAVRVSDNGSGMSRSDMEICWLPHATSKITCAEDLEEVKTLGFRGEALSSLAACSRLEILSSSADDAHRLKVYGGKKVELTAARGTPGTTVSATDLFYNLPARRRFLKSARAEGGLCRRVFLEKAAAHPETRFRFFSDSVLKSFLPESTHRERVNAEWPALAPKESWSEISSPGDGFSLTLVLTRPEQSRHDRQYIQIFANRRRIDEFSLVQAVSYAFDPWMPGGAFPIVFVFLEIDPALVDFNIHPAKKEARFRDLPAIRNRLIETIKHHLTSQAYRQRQVESDDSLHPRQGELLAGEPVNRYQKNSPHPGDASPQSRRPDMQEWVAAAEKLRHQRSSGQLERSRPLHPAAGATIRYLGQIMGVFLLAEADGVLYIVDQHAAHERILFDRFRSSASASEKLLIPQSIHPDAKTAMRLELRQDRLAEMGLVVENRNGEWLLCGLPSAAKGLENEVVDFLESGTGDAEGLEKSLWADLSCKAAVKDNDTLDDETARQLLNEALALEIPRCPHGRPIWFQVSRRELFELVGRTV